jgi:hypothetical protein
VFPVVHFLVKLKAVVILVHLNLFGVVPKNGISAATTYLDNISAYSQPLLRSLLGLVILYVRLRL